MHYNFPITVPPNTPATDPQLTELNLVPGVIHHVDIQFPPGCAGLAHIMIRQGLTQIWPLNSPASYASDDETIPWTEYFELLPGEDTLIAECYNEDDTYEHTITLRIAILPSEVLAPTDQSLPLVKRLYQYFFGRGSAIISLLGLWGC